MSVNNNVLEKGDGEDEDNEELNTLKTRANVYEKLAIKNDSLTSTPSSSKKDTRNETLTCLKCEEHHKKLGQKKMTLATNV